MLKILIFFILSFSAFASEWHFARAGSSLCALSPEKQLSCKSWQLTTGKYISTKFTMPPDSPQEIYASHFSPYGLFCVRGAKDKLTCYRGTGNKMEVVVKKEIGPGFDHVFGFSLENNERLSICTAMGSNDIKCWEPRKLDTSNRKFIPELEEKAAWVIRSGSLRKPVDFFTVSDVVNVHKRELKERTFIVLSGQNLYKARIEETYNNGRVVMTIDRDLRRLWTDFKVEKLFHENILMAPEGPYSWEFKNKLIVKKLAPKKEGNSLKVSNVGTLYECDKEGTCWSEIEGNVDFKFGPKLKAEPGDEILEFGDSHCLLKLPATVLCQPSTIFKIDEKTGLFQTVLLKDADPIKVF